MTKCYFLLFTIITCHLAGYAQLNLNDFNNFEFGTPFQLRQKIINLFKQDNKYYTVYKTDFLNISKIQFDHAPFDYYGDADYYTFLYVKDSLADIEIEYKFPEFRIGNFSRFVKQLISDLNEKYHDARIQFKFEKLNLDIIIRIAETECKSDAKCLPREVGAGIWNTKNQNSFDNKVIMVEMSMTYGQHGFDVFDKGAYHNQNYTGAWMNVKISLTEVRTAHLYFLYYHQKEPKYSPIEIIDGEWRTTWDKNEKGITEKLDTRIDLREENGIYKLPVKLNGVLTLDFVLDLGASDISISPDVYLVLIKSGTIGDEDYIGNETYQFADGTTAKSAVINLKSITIGNKVLENVRASVSKSIDAPLLLGQSAMKKLNNYKIDVENKVLVIE